MLTTLPNEIIISIVNMNAGLSSMPSEPKILSLYLTHLSGTSKFSTLKRRIASISVIHKMKGHYLDTKHPVIMENLHGIKGSKGSNQKAKKPILINELKLIINAIDKANQIEKKKLGTKQSCSLVFLEVLEDQN